MVGAWDTKAIKKDKNPCPWPPVFFEVWGEPKGEENKHNE